ncbi:4-hydroxy-3-methylbut-2-enyl diphosphate reductase [Saccharothrix syringae]|uniref:4-hydroxy-3-methylbut-2-enyl diphosphate reductase n=1 Tax=Saccharothrix syringae TaxID=103733 RepID=A0A5Q0GXP6_SACSY|nr:4-hydroxy-3-methylbut-2-enyl diphosphate reductase [Saccharothrix syringae]QFZ18455.1 4-hydroxy-3-methylbut-2-enyl diphosphate reductase [Saccharothrix syringae]
MSVEPSSHHIADTAIGGSAPGEVVVASEVLLDGGERIRCPAAPLLRGALRGRGLDARLAPVTARRSRDGEPATLLVTGSPTEGCGLAVAAHDAHALAVARAELRAATAAFGARRVLLASPRSFCAGVERAIEVVERLLEKNGPPVYVRKQIVHNTHVVRQLEQRGAVFVEDVEDVPEGVTVVFSAHGVSPAVREAATARGLDVVDATCPLVTKVHAEARRFAQRGDTVVFIGHAGHEETEGTLGEAPDRMVLVQDAADVATLEVADPRRVSYLTQTTLAVDEAEAVVDALRAKFPALRGPRSEDICYATTNRQDALRAVVEESDVVLVVGSDNSSNSRRLAELARRGGTPAHLVDDAAQIAWTWLAGASTVGLTAGASAPSALVEEVVAALSGLGPVEVEERRVTSEDIRFAPPRKVVAP